MPIALFVPYRAIVGRVMRIKQYLYNVNIYLIGDIQHMYAMFTTPAYITLDDITLDDIALPEGAMLDRASVSLDSVQSDRKMWRIAVYYNPADLEGTTTYTMRLKGETNPYRITSSYAKS